MIEVLSKVFIKDKDTLEPSDVRRKYGILLGGVGIFFNIVLFLIKIFCSLLTGSVSIFADAFNNISDAGSSLIQLIGYKLSEHKPDTEHPFGHGRIEYVSGLIISIIILFMGVELFRTSVLRIIYPFNVYSSRLAVVILIISIFVKLYMYYYNKKYSEKLNSVVMQATAFDSLSDCVATSVVLLSMMIYEYTGMHVDGIAGVLVALFIINTGFTSAKDTVNPLLGEKADPEFVNKIANFVLSYDDVLGVHDLVVHDYGAGRMMITLHAEVSAKGDFVKLHDTIDSIERRLQKVLGCQTVIHMDPIVTDDEVTNRMKRFCVLIAKSIDENLSIHDFRMVAGHTHTKLIFDILVPFDVELSEIEVRKIFEEKISAMPGNLVAVINTDRPMY